MINLSMHWLASLDRKTLHRYIGATVGSCLLVWGMLMYYRYSSIQTLLGQFEEINDTRVKIKGILDKAERVKQQQAHVDAMLSEDEDFLINGYFGDIIQKLQLMKVEGPMSTRAERTDNYSENSSTARFTNMNMKQITDLLYELEKTERIYTKELAISRNSKNRDILDVKLTIATLMKQSPEGARR